MAKGLSRDEVIKVANLARIDLDDHEIETYSKELSEIIDYVNMLQEVNVDGLKPTNQVSGLTNVWRADEIIDYGYKADQLLKNVPETKANYIKAKRMIE